MLHCGAKLVLVDIQKNGDAETRAPEMDYDALEKAISPSTKAIIAADLGGSVCNYDRIFEIVERKKDMYSPKGSDGSAFSFHAFNVGQTTRSRGADRI